MIWTLFSWRTPALRAGLATFIALFGTIGSAAEPRPVASETREFEILVNDAKAGSSTINISTFADGRTLASSAADVKVTVLLYTYVYQFSGTEEWLEDRPRSLNSRTVDGSKKMSLRAQFEVERTTLQTADGKVRAAPSHVLTTNFWRSPPDDVADKRVAVIDADTGKTLQLRFQRMEPKTLTLLGKPYSCQHFKVTGDKELELWFDGSGHLVRQVGLEDGYKTEFRLSAFRQGRPEPR